MTKGGKPVWTMVINDKETLPDKRWVAKWRYPHSDQAQCTNQFVCTGSTVESVPEVSQIKSWKLKTWVIFFHLFPYFWELFCWRMKKSSERKASDIVETYNTAQRLSWNRNGIGQLLHYHTPFPIFPDI
jgi:hypothetical protein